MYVEFIDRHKPSWLPGLFWPKHTTQVQATFEPREEELLSQFKYWRRIVYTTCDENGFWRPYILMPFDPVTIWVWRFVLNDTILVKDLRNGIAFDEKSLAELYEKRSKIRTAIENLSLELAVIANPESYERFDPSEKR